MPAILGLRDTASDASFRFENWRRIISYTFPNGQAPLTAILSLAKGEPTDDPNYHWFQQSLDTEASVLTAPYTNVATQIHVAATEFRAGQMIMNQVTGERMLVTAVDNTGLVLTVQRATWGAAAADSGSTTPYDTIVCIGNANPEGGPIPNTISYDPTPVYNKTQIFRTPFGGTGTDLKTAMKYDKAGPYTKRMHDALSTHSIEMEKAFLFGIMAEWANVATNTVERTTGGIIPQIISAGNVDDIATTDGAGKLTSGALTVAEWDSILEKAFRVSLNKNNEKLCLCGSGVLGVLNAMSKEKGRINLTPVSTNFGMQFQEYISPYGTVYFKSHPLFVQNPTWRYMAVILDIKGLYYRYLKGRDTQKLVNRQNPGDDKKTDEFFTEAGLEYHHPEAHYVVLNVKNFDPTNAYANPQA